MEKIQVLFMMLSLFWELMKPFLPGFAIGGLILFFIMRKGRKNRQNEIDYLAKKIAEEMKKEE